MSIGRQTTYHCDYPHCSRETNADAQYPGVSDERHPSNWLVSESADVVTHFCPYHWPRFKTLAGKHLVQPLDDPDGVVFTPTPPVMIVPVVTTNRDATAAIFASTDRIAADISAGRVAAHAKHGDNSIEAHAAGSAVWWPILMEAIGELAHEDTYDSTASLADQATGMRRRRAEMLDIATVVVAWIASTDRAIAYIERVT